MTTLAPGAEEILEKLVRIAYGNPALVQQALANASTESGRVPTLEEVVQYILDHRDTPPHRADTSAVRP